MKTNMNPFRCGLQLYAFVDELQKKFDVSHYKIGVMKQDTLNQLVKIQDAYKDIEEVMPLLEEHDFHGLSCFDYISEMDLGHVLNTELMEQIITKKWTGGVTFTASVLDFSSSFKLLKSKYESLNDLIS